MAQAKSAPAKGGRSRTSRSKTARPQKAKSTTGQPETVAIDEASLTKGDLRRLNATRKWLGKDRADRAFLERQKELASEVKVDPRTQQIAAAIEKLIEETGLKIPPGGYIVRRGRGRVIVEPVKKAEG